MPLIASISGIRGTIGGFPGSALSPEDLLKFTAAYAQYLRENSAGKSAYKVVLGRDARISGTMVNQLVCGSLLACGIDVIDLGLATTPTVEMAVVAEAADGGIILTASHNPREWNALKLLNAHGEFLNAQEGARLMSAAQKGHFYYVSVDDLGQYSQKDLLPYHIEAILALPEVNVEAIYRAGYKVVVDAVNSVGGIAVPQLLESLGVSCIPLHCEPHGDFAHNPEPLPEHLQELSAKVVAEQADLGISVDPDVDRLALVCEDGSMFGEEYTLVAVTDYIISRQKGSVVSNLSSSRALYDIAQKHDCQHFRSAVGEVNVAAEMKERQAVIGGEGNGGVIYPPLHYGRDALVGIALFLTHLAAQGVSASQLRQRYPNYYMSKNKLELPQGVQIPLLFAHIKELYKDQTIKDIDGVHIDFVQVQKWVHLRASNTEPVLRIYAEAADLAAAEALAQDLIQHINNYINAL